VGIGFLYAIKHHPAMRYAIGPRREMGQRTIFNLLGPLSNPAGATHQLIGVYDAELTETLPAYWAIWEAVPPASCMGQMGWMSYPPRGSIGSAG
jgi:hypothetical protein